MKVKVKDTMVFVEMKDTKNDDYKEQIDDIENLSQKNNHVSYSGMELLKRKIKNIDNK